MNKNLDEVLSRIGRQYENQIDTESRNYIEVNIGGEAKKYGFSDIHARFENVFAIVPIKEPVSGMKVLIDGRTFVDYALFDSGVAVPGYVAGEAGLPRRNYVPHDSMILNFN